MTYLLILMSIVAISQPAGNRRAACCCFVGLTLSFDLVQPMLPGTLYYLSAAATGAICIGMLGLLRADVWLIRALERLCLVSIALNFAGWIGYEFYLPTAPYDLCFEIFYASAIIVLIIGGPAGGLLQKRRGLPRVLLHTD